MPVISFGEWMPDAAPLMNPGCVAVKNCFPGITGFRSVGALNTISSALDTYPRAAITCLDKDANVRMFAADKSKLWELSTITWTDRSAGGYTTTTAEETVEMLQWKNRVISTNFSDVPQVLTLGGTVFADLTTALKFRHLGIVRDNVVGGNTWDSGDGNVPNRVRWAAYNDETDWTVSSSTLAGSQDLPTGRRVRCVLGGEYGVIVCQEAIWRMSWVGAPVAYQFDETVPSVGTLGAGAAVRVGDVVFLWSEKGFIALTGGANAQYIGSNKIDKFARADLDIDFAYRISSVADPGLGRVMWAYPGSGHTGGRPNKILVFDWNLGQWSIIEDDIELIWRAAGSSYTMEGLDAISSSLDDLTISLDSESWKGGAPQLAAFETDFKHGFFNGAPMAGSFETKELQLHNGRRAVLKGFSPLVNGGAVSARVGHRRRQVDSVSYTASLTQSAEGRFSSRVNNNFHRIELNTSGQWDHAMGVEIRPQDARPEGLRG